MPEVLNHKGLTLIELIISLVILSILSMAVLPLSQITVKRSRELELRQSLRSIRGAIDQFKKDWFEKRIARTAVDVVDEVTGYPKSLESLVAGVPSGNEGGAKLRYLRRIPKDPLSDSEEWGLRCYEDEVDSTLWCGNNVYDIYSQSDEEALDGSKYSDW